MKRWRLAVLALTAVGVGLAVTWGQGSWSSPPLRLQAAIGVAVQRAAPVPLDVKCEPVGNSLSEWFGLHGLAEGALQGVLASRGRRCSLSHLSFATSDGQATRVVTCLLIEPAAPATAGVTLYLPSSWAAQPERVEAEGLTAYGRLPEPRRLLVLPLPLAEQRGAPWPTLSSLDLQRYGVLSLQTAVDAERAGQALAQRNLAFDGLAGASLGGCLATVVAARPSFRGAELSLFAAGGDLARLAKSSSSVLGKALAKPARLSRHAYRRLLAALDPAAHLSHAVVRRVELTVADNDDVIPAACSQALVKAAQRAKLECRVQTVKGGHTAVLGVPGVLAR